LRELGRLERTLFTLDWIEDPALRRTTGQELNKGESRNSLARAVFIHRLGEIRDRTYENQQHRASGLGQGAVLLETRDWDDLPERVMVASYSASRSLRTAAI
jgi:hypothetical protein